jgi:WD40 repeat protein/serine/threonine protein kinase
MDQKRWQRIEELLQQALDLDESKRHSFLENSCGFDSELRRQVETLLDKQEQARSFIETPVVAQLAQSLTKTTTASLIRERISHYRIESLIGIGGMGEVYKAHDENLRRTVALKILPAAFINDVERSQRFEQEAFATSKLNHPNIVTIFEIVQADETQFMVSEFVEGQTLRQLLTDEKTSKPRSLASEQAIDIAIQIASALKAAHTAWIIHRDVKPENIMVRSDGVVKVLDFGIAKMGPAETPASPPSGISKEQVVSDEPEGANGFKTIPGAIVGTASYMSPEQAKGEQLDGRTDVFSLGAVLYEMVSGERLLGPIASSRAGNGERLPLASPRRLEGVPRELERIIRRAIKRQRDERYGSAAEMLDDLRRLRQRLANRSAHRIAKVSGVALLAVVALAAISAWASRGQVWDERILRDGHTAAVRRAVFSPDGRRLVSVGEDRQVIVWDFARRERLKTFTDHSGTVNTVAFSPDGKWFATGSDDKTVIIWDALRLEKAAVLPEHQAPVLNVVFSPDGKHLVSGYGPPSNMAIVWDTDGWKKVRELPWGVSYGNFLFLSNGRLADNYGRIWNVTTGQMTKDKDPNWFGNWVDVSADGTRWASMASNGDVKFVDVTLQKSLGIQHAHFDHGRSVVFSPDGKWLATAAERIMLWDAKTLTRIAPLEYESIVWSVAFSPDGHWLVSTHGDGAILVWDSAQRERVANLREHSAGVRGVAFSPDGRKVASGSEDQSVIVWDAERGQKEAVLTGHHTRVNAVAFAPNGQWLASSDQDGVVIRWGIQRWLPELTISAPSKDTPSYCLAISRDGRWIACTHGVYESDTGRRLVNLIGELGTVYGAAFTSDGRRLVCTTDRGNVILWDTQTWRIVASDKWAHESLITVSLSPDGKYLITGDDGKSVRLGTIDPLAQLYVVGQHEARIKSVVFSADGSSAASAGDDKTIALWDINGRKLITRIGTHASPVYALALSPNGQQLISGEHDRSVRMYTRHRTMWGFRFD